MKFLRESDRLLESLYFVLFSLQSLVLTFSKRFIDDRTL